MIFLFRPSTHSKYNMCSVLAFFHYRENFNLISFAPLLGYLMSFFQIQKAKLRQKMVFRVRKEGLLLSVSSSSSILHGAGGGNEKVMRLFLPPPPRTLLEKTDEPELANKVKTIRGEDAHARTHTTHKKKKKTRCARILLEDWLCQYPLHFCRAICLLFDFLLHTRPVRHKMEALLVIETCPLSGIWPSSNCSNNNGTG